MKNLKNIKKGDTVIVAVQPNSNASRGKDMSLDNINNWTFKGAVVSVGRKYITVEWDSNYFRKDKFTIEDNYAKKVDFGSYDHSLYSCLEEIYDERETEQLIDKVRGRIGRYGKTDLSLAQLVQILNILEEGQDNE